MAKKLYIGRALFALIPFLTINSTAQAALANRVFVSARSGNDSNACNNILTPCQTFAGAVLQLNPGGEAIVLDSGGYGPVTITQALTIEAPPGVTAFIHPPSGDAITVNAGASDVVTLRGLVLNSGTSTGITVNSVGILNVESCAINGFVDGIFFLAPNGFLAIKNSDIKNCSFAGVEIGNSSGLVFASLDHTHLDENFVGFRNEPLSTGTAKTTLTACTANKCSVGFANFDVDTSAAETNLEFCVATGDPSGFMTNTSNVASKSRLSNSTLTNNTMGVNFFGSGGTVFSRQNNTIAGNSTDVSGGTLTALAAQ